MNMLTVERRQDCLVVDSRLVASGLGIQHKNFLETIYKYETLICQRFGVVTFETDKPLGGSQGGRPEKFAWLTEDQSIFLMTLSRNTEQVVQCKVNLVEAFKVARQSIPQIPQSYAQALLEAGRLALELEKAEAEKAMLEEHNHLLAEAVDELHDYSSIIRIAKFNDVSETRFRWQTLKSMTIRMGLEVKRVPCPRFETKLLYPHDVWRVCYPWAKLPETITLTITPR